MCPQAIGPLHFNSHRIRVDFQIKANTLKVSLGIFRLSNSLILAKVTTWIS
jgi:hypothetical protein